MIPLCERRCWRVMLTLPGLAMAAALSFGQNVAPAGLNPGRTAAGPARRPMDTQPAAPARDPARIVRIAVVQAGENHYAQGNPGPEANFNIHAQQAREAAAARPRPEVIVFPEFAISGWPYPSEEKLNQLAEPVPGDGPWYSRYRALARETGAGLLAWLLERDGERLYNTACLIDGQGRYRGKYHKVQTTLGEQGWWGWSKGRRFEVLELDGVRYGISICADMCFPETVRCEELMGADVILHQSVGDDMGPLIPARAIDSKLPIVLAVFQGGSYAVDGEGNLLGKLPSDKPGWKTFELRPFRLHRSTKYAGLFDTRKADYNLRCPEAYSVLVDPAKRPAWTDVFLDNEGRPQTREQILNRFHGHYDSDDRGPPGSPAATAPAAH
jgi:predicted amidohydrolase